MRYIDADKLIEFIEKRGAGLGVTVANCCNFKDIVKMIPTEDVVSRSEVEELQNKYEQRIAELEREIEDLESTQEITPEAKHFIDTKADKMISLLTEINKTQDQLKQEVAEQIFEELEQEAYKNDEGDLYLDLPDYLKIKKKYIGE